jgi:hypothetical protein
VRTRSAIVGLLAVVVVSTSACDPLDRGGSVVPPAGDAAASVTTLDGLTVASWAPMTGYSRDRFHHWDPQGAGCDTRDVVLKRDGLGVEVGANCAIAKGSWISAYDGATVTDPQSLDVDHMVPLANAWRTGAASWSDDQREAFANDLTRPQLLAVTATSNRSKGDQDPSEWKPPRRDYWCTYARDWITVKAYWKLSVTAAEKAALTDMLRTCT